MATVPEPLVAVVMGVSGCGKSTIGARLAQSLGWDFLDGDSLHTPAAIAKMRAGQPLDDADRAPWLEAIAAWIAEHVRDRRGGVVTCSALKRRYRETLRGGRDEVLFVHLHGSRQLLEQRVRLRRHEYMPASLLDSQLADLEPLDADERGVTIDIAQSPAAVTADALRVLRPEAASELAEDAKIGEARRGE
ncbi:MAG: gluconokinase [Streptosporangiales bacterium]|nr:gluconokinase [Streptosporangiales bacterium]MBO0889949.1 gluconokinase [Acidothermales bacterium]